MSDPGSVGKLLVGMAALAAVAGCSPGASNGASASAPAGGGFSLTSLTGGGMTTFTEPSHQAFTVSVPAGWTATGGLVGASPSTMKTWFKATSPDGATTISLGDPSIPGFTLPSQMHANGSTVQTAAGQSPVEPYENGVQFAADYAQRAWGQTCQLQQTGSQAEPALAQEAQNKEAQLAQSLGVPMPNAQYDAGSVLFTCTANGVAKAVAVIDVTSQMPAPMGGGFWSVAGISTYTTPAASQAQTDQIARAMMASSKPTPQWQAQQLADGKQQLAQIQQQGQQAMAALTRQEASERSALSAQMQSANARLNAEHASTMNWLNAQGQRINQNFAAQQYNKETGQQSEMRYINNQTCVRWADAAHTRCAVTAPN